VYHRWERVHPVPESSQPKRRSGPGGHRQNHQPGRPLENGKKRKARSDPVPQGPSRTKRARRVSNARAEIQVPDSQPDVNRTPQRALEPTQPGLRRNPPRTAQGAQVLPANTSAAQLDSAHSVTHVSETVLDQPPASDQASLARSSLAPPRPGSGKNAFRTADGGVQVLPVGAPQPHPDTIISASNISPTEQDEPVPRDPFQTPPPAPAPTNVLICPTATQQAQASNSAPSTTGSGQLNGFANRPYPSGLGKSAQRTSGGGARIHPFGLPAAQWNGNYTAERHVNAMTRASERVQDVEGTAD